jgi:cell division protein FtsI (penicillin-binding protein 3)
VTTELTSNELTGPRGRWIRLRMGILCALLALGLGLVLSAGWDLMIVHGGQWRELAERQRQRRLNVQPKRGSLYDRNGTALAVSIEVPSVSMDSVEMLRDVPPPRIPFVARDAANRIAAALGLDPVMVERKILQKRRFTWLKRRVSAAEVDSIRKLCAGDGDPNRRLLGLNVEGESHRYYPRRELAGSLLGFVAPDGRGKDGLELALDSELQGHPNQLAGLRDRSGRLLFAEAVEDDAALAGHDIALTIDQAIQFTAERELAMTIQTFEANNGSVVVLDPRTGEILALASFPAYNPNDYETSEIQARRIRSVADTFEPGSSMKIFTIAAGLATGVITPTQQMYCEKGAMRIDKVTIRDTHPSEWLTIPKVLAVSSNICAAKIGMELGSERLYEYLRRFGFGQATGIPATGESTGTLRPRGRGWVEIETAAASFGQGIAVTALQLALATAAIANGGELMEPTLIKRVNAATGELLREAAPTLRRRVIPRLVASQVTELMVGVTEGEGTGTEATIAGYRVAGKTATAQKADPRTGRYSDDKFVASFVGFVPANNPAVLVAVVVDEPMVDHAGGVVAAPVFRRVAQMVLEHKGMTPPGARRASVTDLASRADPANVAYEVIRQAQGDHQAVQDSVANAKIAPGLVRVPDMIGWPMREVLHHVSDLGLMPQVQGTGLLSKEEPAPGQALEKGAALTLHFEPPS